MFFQCQDFCANLGLDPKSEQSNTVYQFKAARGSSPPAHPDCKYPAAMILVNPGSPGENQPALYPSCSPYTPSTVCWTRSTALRLHLAVPCPPPLIPRGRSDCRTPWSSWIEVRLPRWMCRTQSCSNQPGSNRENCLAMFLLGPADERWKTASGWQKNPERCSLCHKCPSLATGGTRFTRLANWLKKTSTSMLLNSSIGEIQNGSPQTVSGDHFRCPP